MILCPRPGQKLFLGKEVEHGVNPVYSGSFDPRDVPQLTLVDQLPLNKHKCFLPVVSEKEVF